jgi:protein dithiol:quinone oxidoreductase
MSEGFLRHAPRLLVLLGVACLLALGVALVSQHQFGVKPCPWCVLQRGIVLLLAVFAIVGGALAWAVKRGGSVRAAHLAARLASIPVVVLALAGLVAATYQHEVAAEMASCDQTLADRVLTALELERRWPYMFMITANCADASKYRLLGLPYELWSGALFAFALGGGLIAMLRGSRS